jgi:hypothetical protein
MIYCVELAFSQPAREAEWSAWYSQHLGVLLSVPGFSTAQRFQSIAPCRAPYLAAYSVSSGAVFDSAPYRQRGGRTSPGEWAPLMINWDRNLFDGLTQIPEVRSDQFLVVVDKPAIELAAFGAPLHRLQCVGLDHTVQSRGIAALSADQYASVAAEASEHTRFYRALTAQLRATT